jgi:hypothetical protein
LVSPTLALVIAGGIIIALAKFGSPVKAFGELLGSDFSSSQQRAESGEVTVDSLQNNPTIPTKQGSQTTIATIQGAEIIRTNVSSKRKMDQGSAKPQIRTTFFDLKSGGSEPQIGTTKTTNVSANFSNGAQFGTLTKEQVGSIRAQPFTKQEQEDIDNLTRRLQSKSEAQQKLKDSPEEVIFKKREQEFIAKQQLGGSNFVKSGGIRTRGGFLIEEKGGLFGSSGFALGGVSRETFEKQQREKALIDKKIIENALLNKQREETGQQILSTIQKSGMNQKQFLQGKGINLQGGNLNAKAIARLQEKGLL